MPPKAVIPEEGLIHDYFFLFLEPTEGEGRLDLICNTISLETQEVQSRVYHPISLIQLGYLPEGAGAGNRSPPMPCFRRGWEIVGLISA